MSREIENQIKVLKNKRSQIKSRITRYSNFFNNADNKGKLEEIANRLEKLQPCLEEFEDAHSQISILDSEQVNEQELIEFENIYYELISETKRHLQIAKQTVNCTPSISNNSVNTVPQVKLPNIQLPCFNGQFTEWVTFRDTFQSLIHNSETLSPIEKFHYLKGCLKSVSLQTIEHLTLSDNNYQVAWDLLKKRFENKRLITQHHIRNIFALPAITKDSNSARQLLHGLTTNIKALESIDRPVQSWDDILVHLVTTKFDYHTTISWEGNLTSEPPTLNKLTEFLTQRCQTLEAIEINTINKPSLSTSQKMNKFQKKLYNQTTSHVSSDQGTNICAMCKQLHYLYKCKKFISLPVNQRVNQIKKLNLCLNCLRAGHSADKCFSGNCKHCNMKHNTLLHLHNNPKPNISVQSQETHEQENINVDNNIVVNAFSDNYVQKTVLLTTALIEIRDNKNKIHICRALIDSGSQSNFITKNLCSKLGSKLDSVNICVGGISQTANNVIYKTRLTIKSRISSFFANLECLVLERITSALPLNKISISSLEIPSNIKLADPHFNEPGQIDILLGAEIFWEILSGGKVETNMKHLYLQNTELGFIIGGKTGLVTNKSNPVCNLSINRLDNQMSKFWEIESFEKPKPMNKDEQICAKHFQETVTRTPSGRFVVKLPFRDNPPDLGLSRNMALKRFISLENKFKRNLSLESEYKSFINEYMLLNHLEPVSPIELENLPSNNLYYLAHHAVFKNSVTTKLRVVFDGSCATSNGKSLNDNLLVGPVLQQNLFDILARFRIHQYVIAGDIAKMYRQILIHPDDRNYQLILWRENPHEPIQTYRLNTVTYGLSSSSFLAIKCLQELATSNETYYPESCQIILNDFYVDDMLTGANTIEGVQKIKRGVTEILASGGFELRKFTSNIPNTLICNSQESPASVSLDMCPYNKTLGVIWENKSDSIKYSVSTTNFSDKPTKRNILSIISSLFDPLGLVSPVTITAKIILQEIWTLNIGWDDALPFNVNLRWIAFLNNFTKLNEITIPRKIIMNESYKSLEIHGFSDSSQNAYGACIYLRATYTNGKITSHLLCSKGRVAPLKTITIPRLELLAALSLAKLVNKVKQNLKIIISKFIYWTDSTIVLSWINMQPNLLKTFVANRIAEIQFLTSSEEWHHVSGLQNPADIISRGTSPQQLSTNELWWYGPDFLVRDNFQSSRNHKLIYDKTHEVPEVKSICCSVTATNNDLELRFLTKYSSWLKTLRVMAYILRFKWNSRNTKIKHTGQLSVYEIQNAHHTIIKIIQTQSFSKDIHHLKTHGEISKNSRLKALNAYLDKEGILRVGGRLRNAPISHNSKHQIILPKNHHVTQLLISHYHVTEIHAGCQATMAALRHKYWIVSCRSAVRNIIFKCVTCFKIKPKLTDQLMGDLPKARVTPSRPFSCTAVDYAGPIVIKNGHGRTTKTIKAYIALFVCLATKAIHLELVCDCSSSTFLNALKRFIARRGKVSILYSDNGTNFVGAHREINKLLQSVKFKTDVIESLTNDQIQWKFIPPKSPHMNGLAEAAVKSTKHHLKRIIGNSLLNYEEMYTILTMIEACLNSRPLTPLSSDPSDLSALTPGHFLIGDALTAPCEPDLQQTPCNRLSRYQLLEKLRQHFWTRWSTEYLHQLQQRSKWTKAKQPPAIGALVLLRENNIPPQHWILGRIQEHHPGADNIVRTVSVKTVRGVQKRVVSKICPLPCE